MMQGESTWRFPRAPRAAITRVPIVHRQLDRSAPLVPLLLPLSLRSELIPRGVVKLDRGHLWAILLWLLLVLKDLHDITRWVFHQNLSTGTLRNLSAKLSALTFQF